MSLVGKNNNVLPNEAAVTEYLLEHPDYLARNPQVLIELNVPHRCGKAVSLVEHQMGVIRDQNRHLKRRLRELIDNARENEALVERLIRFSMQLNECVRIEQVIDCLYKVMTAEFDVEHAVVRVFAENAGSPVDALIPMDDNIRALFGHVFVRGKPVCGRLQSGQLDFLFGDARGVIASSALLPLGLHGSLGLLAMGSSDPQRFHPAQATDFLRQVSEIVSSAIAPHVAAA